MSEVFEALWEAPLRTRGWVEFDPEFGLVRFVGIQHGETHLLTAYDVPGLGLVAMVREVPGKHWAARGVQKSHPAQVTAIVLEPQPQVRNRHRYVRLVSSDLGKNDETRAANSASLMRHMGLGLTWV